MKKNRLSVAGGIAILSSVVLVGGAMALVSSPASAKSGINWQHVWRTEIKPRADKRYYTKTKANAIFARTSALANYYSKTEADARYAFKSDLGNYYTKAQSDAKYAPFPAVIRGTYSILDVATAVGQTFGDNISFGVTLSAAPTAHYIPAGGTVPAGCSGTPAAPNASPGNLCVFEGHTLNTTAVGVYGIDGAAPALGVSNPFGAGVYANSAAAGNVYAWGSWAVRPTALSASKVPASPHRGGGGFIR